MLQNARAVYSLRAGGARSRSSAMGSEITLIHRPSSTCLTRSAMRWWVGKLIPCV